MNKDSYIIQILDSAKFDLNNIYSYVIQNDSIQKAKELLTTLEKHCQSLTQFPERGSIPVELQRIYISSFRQIHYKSYRIIYQIIEKNVYIWGVLDGRRDLQHLLMQRLLKT